MLGIGPLVFVPISNTFGRRPVWILTILCALLLNIGVSLCQSYGAHISLRILIPFFLSPPIALGGAVVAETFFASQRATKLVRQTLDSFSLVTQLTDTSRAIGRG
jgi:MFS family permease